MGFFEFFMITSLADDSKKVLPKRKKGLQNAYIRQNKWGMYEIVYEGKVLTRGTSLMVMESLLDSVKNSKNIS